MPSAWDGNVFVIRDGREHAYHLGLDRYLPIADAPLPAGPPECAARHRAPRRPMPVPGTDGNYQAHGVDFYDDWPRFEFATVLFNTICAPAALFVEPDADIDPEVDWYYLTATNGAARGVEAFVSYWQTRHPEFWVFDWSIPACDATPRAHGPIPFADLAPYWITAQTDVGPLPALCVVNATTMLPEDGARWRNTVLVFRPGADGSEARFDRVYVRDYQSTVAEQRNDGGRVHFWGPILESGTSSQRHATHPAGFVDAALLVDGDLTYLSPSNSYRSATDPAARVVHLRPNHALVVALRPDTPTPEPG